MTTTSRRWILHACTTIKQINWEYLAHWTRQGEQSTKKRNIHLQNTEDKGMRPFTDWTPCTQGGFKWFIKPHESNNYYHTTLSVMINSSPLYISWWCLIYSYERFVTQTIISSNGQHEYYQLCMLWSFSLLRLPELLWMGSKNWKIYEHPTSVVTDGEWQV